MAHDVLQRLVANSRSAIKDGTYDAERLSAGPLEKSGRDLARDIAAAPHAAIISEIKFASPSQGRLRAAEDPAGIASQMVRGGALGLSVLTQPHLFGGSPEYFARVRQAVRDTPMIMKDVIIDEIQIDAAERIGADYILLIEAVLGEGGAASAAGRTTAEMMSYARSGGLGVILEVHTAQEYGRALGTDADIIGINNRNLDTLEIDIGTTQSILGGDHQGGRGGRGGRVVISESGIATPGQVRMLRGAGADGFLIGTHIMKSGGDCIEEAVRELVRAY